MLSLHEPRDRAALLILLLATAIALALIPFLSGLFGAAVLYVICLRPYQWLERRMRPGFAAALTLIATLVVIALPLAWLLARIAQTRIGDYDVGAELARASGTIISWLSRRAFAFVGSATSALLNLLIAFFGLYYMLRSGPSMWHATRGLIPFSSATAEALKDRFASVTEATLLGTVLIAVIQGSLVGTAFRIVGLSNPLFWGTVTIYLASISK